MQMPSYVYIKRFMSATVVNRAEMGNFFLKEIKTARRWRKEGHEL